MIKLLLIIVFFVLSFKVLAVVAKVGLSILGAIAGVIGGILSVIGAILLIPFALLAAFVGFFAKALVIGALVVGAIMLIKR